MGSIQENAQSILIIDDDEDDYELVNEAINEINPSIQVEYVSSCEQLIQYRHRTFDFILLDINMPGRDGFFFLKTIRDHGYNDVPIIMYTNSQSPAHIARCYQEGANLFFPKPENFSGLLKGLRKLVNGDCPLMVRDHIKQVENGHYPIFFTD